MRRSTELERIEEEAELDALLFLGDAEDLEYCLLDFLTVNSHRAAADLIAVDYHVVCVRIDGIRIIEEILRLRNLGHGERMVHRGDAAVIGLLERRRRRRTGRVSIVLTVSAAEHAAISRLLLHYALFLNNRCTLSCTLLVAAAGATPHSTLLTPHFTLN